MDIEQMEKNFKDLLLFTHRQGIPDLLEYLETETDFYIAPSSGQYHGNYNGGLLEHSLDVYKHLINLCKVYDYNLSEENLKIIALLHDICKVNFYKSDKRNRKRKDDAGNDILNEYGKPLWYEEPYYSIDDKLPLGHGEKSVIILQRFITLTNNEIMGIRWHMMSYDEGAKGYIGNLTLTKALELYPIISLIHCADLLSISQKIKEI